MQSTASCLNILTQNVNGLNDKTKRLSIIQNLHQKNSNIQILVDTRLKSKDETTIRREAENKEYRLNYSCVFNNREDGTAARGILILISRY